MNSYVSSSIYNCLRSGGGVGTCSALPQAQGLSGLLVRESNCLVMSLNLSCLLDCQSNEYCYQLMPCWEQINYHSFPTQNSWYIWKAITLLCTLELASF